MSEKKNILITTLSLPIDKNRATLNYYVPSCNPTLIYGGLQQQEPVSKYILTTQKIDKVIVIASEECLTSKSNLPLPRNGIATADMNCYKYYKDCITQFLKSKGQENWLSYFSSSFSKEEIALCNSYVKQALESKTNTDINSYNILIENCVRQLQEEHPTLATKACPNDSSPCKLTFKDLVHALVYHSHLDAGLPKEYEDNLKYNLNTLVKNKNGIIKVKYNSKGSSFQLANDLEQYLNKDKNIFIDTQGGERNDSSVITQMILCGQNNGLEIIDTYGTDFHREKAFHAINTQTDKTDFATAMSGIKSFLHYGKASELAEYFSKHSNNQESIEITNLLIDIDNAVTLNDVDSMTTLITKLYSYAQSNNSENPDLVMQLFWSKIKDAFSDLVKDNQADIIAIIHWCLERGFIQQAITLIESKIPRYYYEKKILTGVDLSKTNIEDKDFISALYSYYKQIFIFLATELWDLYSEEIKNNFSTLAKTKKDKVHRKDAIKMMSEDFSNLILRDNPCSSAIGNMLERYKTECLAPLPTYANPANNSIFTSNILNYLTIYKKALDNNKELDPEFLNTILSKLNWTSLPTMSKKEEGVFANTCKFYALKLQRNYINHAVSQDKEERWPIHKLINEIKNYLDELVALV